MSEDRFDLQLAVFEKAVSALELALAQPEDEFIRDSIIKRFELAFETARKCLRRWLLEQQEISGNATKKDVMEAAYRVGLLGDSAVWDDIVACRNDCSHEYDASKAIAASAFVRERAFAAFAALLGELKQRA